MKVFICLAILVAAVCAAPFEGGASGSQAGANAATQTFQQGGGGFYPHSGFVPFGSSGSQAGATAQTQSFHQGGGGGFGPHGHGFGAPPSFGASGASAGASTQTFQQGGLGHGHGGGASGSQAAASAQTQTFHT